MAIEQAGSSTPSLSAQDLEPSPSPAASTERPSLSRSPASNPNFSSLPPLTTTLPSRSHGAQKKPSYADKRLSTFSSHSFNIHNSSRPQSNSFPFFFSSLPYALVRDFAYPTNSQLHYGHPVEQPSNASTPGSERHRRTSDPLNILRSGNSRLHWSSDDQSHDASYFGLQLPARSFGDGDGPPYAEDADLLSPVVTSTKHKKSKSSVAEYNGQPVSSAFIAHAFDGLDHGGGVRLSNGQLGTDNSMASRQSTWRSRLDQSGPIDRASGSAHSSGYMSTSDSHLPLNPASSDYETEDDGSRLSRAYQFTIASPDEEFHGKAVALFDFERENDNELPFVEGQVLWVSYRHGEGWLVAQDPKTGESGLIPEEYVRLLRDIEGGLRGLNGGDPNADDEADFDTPIDIRRPNFYPSDIKQTHESGHERSTSGQHYVPVVSHFTTSSKDLQPYLVAHPTSQPSAGAANAGSGSPPSTSQLNTPVPNSQPTFSGHTFFDDRDDENDGKNANSSSTVATTNDSRTTEFLSPETFRREDRIRNKSEGDGVVALADEAHAPS